MKIKQKIDFAAILFVACIVLFSQPVLADPHVNQSKEVVIIGGTTLSNSSFSCGIGDISTDANVMYYTGGGCLPVTGEANLTAFNFTPMHPSNVSAANLTPYDTVVLNMASSAMMCNSSKLTTAQQNDLVNFVDMGKKLIIYDSECWTNVDYSWHPYPFNTSNPGAVGATGTLTIVEENTLSSNITGDPHYIDAAYLGGSTDAVGDMNVMTTYDTNWCLDMSGTNYLGVTGPVHTYAKSPPGTDTGLYIYNGLDMDYLYNGNLKLYMVWLFELQQPFNPSELPCLHIVVPITIEKDFRYTNVNFVPYDPGPDGILGTPDDIQLPADLGNTLSDGGNGLYDVDYVIKAKKGTVSSTNPGQLYGVINITGVGVMNVTVNDAFDDQFDVNPGKLGGGVEVIRVNATGYAEVLTDTQVTSDSVDNSVNEVELVINLTAPLDVDEHLMIYIKFQTTLKHETPDYTNFVNEVNAYIDETPMYTNATIEFH